MLRVLVRLSLLVDKRDLDRDSRFALRFQKLASFRRIFVFGR